MTQILKESHTFSDQLPALVMADDPTSAVLQFASISPNKHWKLCWRANSWIDSFISNSILWQHHQRSSAWSAPSYKGISCPGLLSSSLWAPNYKPSWEHSVLAIQTSVQHTVLVAWCRWMSTGMLRLSKAKLLTAGYLATLALKEYNTRVTCNNSVLLLAFSLNKMLKNKVTIIISNWKY